MKNIKVRILTMGGDEHEVETPTDMKIKDLIYELAMALNLPLTDVEGSYIRWRLNCKDLGKILIEDQNLEQNGVQEGYRLLMLRQTLAGTFVEKGYPQHIFTSKHV